MTRDDIIRMAREAGASFETAESMFRFAALVAAAERELRPQPHPAEPTESAEDDDLYWRLHAMSKSLEGAGRLDEHDNPDAYGTVLDAMNFVKQHSGQRGEE